ncbi:MAG: serine protease Do [Bradymonadia bacterium]|jgi:serine protease Do
MRGNTREQHFARHRWWSAPSAALLAVCVLACAPDSARAPAETPSPIVAEAAIAELPFEEPAPPPGLAAPPSFADLVELVGPSVVNIYTEQRQIVERRTLPDPWGRSGRILDERVANSLGSGFVVDDLGHILTNSHVIEDATSVRVVFADERELDAEVVGVDPLTDIALLRVAAFDGMTFLPLGDSDAMRVGDWTVAVGNPFGLSSTVTAGILSARGRRDVPVGGLVRYVDFLQTDASINPGNSGGPLINLSGEVVGINTAVNAEGQGIAFAIPSSMVAEVLPQLRDNGRVSRSWLGVFLDDLDPALALAAGLQSSDGALVTDVVRGGPAQIAGLRRGDVIVRFGDEAIAQSDDLKWIAAEAGVGAHVQVQVVRNGRPIMAEVVMGELPE